MTETRRLAAIMAVDVVGYSRLMGEDEAGTARAVLEARRAALPIIGRQGGRVVKTMGDGFLLEFASVVSAVDCALQIQQMMAMRDAGVADDKRLVYRVGINLGDVLIDGDEILGEGVNIAARLESACQPGGILISGSAYEQTRGRVEAEFVDVGEQELKNIARPVRAYAVTTGAEVAPWVPPKPVVAKLSERAERRAAREARPLWRRYLPLILVFLFILGLRYIESEKKARLASPAAPPAASVAPTP